MTIIFATFIVVFGRALQQMHVVNGHYIPAAITPYFIAIGEVLVVLMIVDTGWQAIPLVGTGGALGAVSAMWIHRKIWAQR